MREGETGKKEIGRPKKMFGWGKKIFLDCVAPLADKRGREFVACLDCLAAWSKKFWKVQLAEEWVEKRALVTFLEKLKVRGLI